jgi:hypothetical protein
MTPVCCQHIQVTLHVVTGTKVMAGMCWSLRYWIASLAVRSLSTNTASEWRPRACTYTGDPFAMPTVNCHQSQLMLYVTCSASTTVNQEW